VVEKYERLANDTCQEADRTVNALPAALEVAKAAKLESFELGIYNVVSIASKAGVVEAQTYRSLRRESTVPAPVY